jgi:hypothetical protein
MGEKALWPTVVIVSIVAASITAMLIAGVEVVAVIAVFSVFGNLIQIVLYGKMSKVEQNTNGQNSQLMRTVNDLVQHAKNSVPLEAVDITAKESHNG